MLQPITHTWHHARPTGLGFDPSVYLWTQSIDRGYGLAGLGLTIQQESAQIGGMAASIASMFPGVGPLVGAAIGLATQAAMVIESMFAGCGDTCVQATQIANQVAGILGQNVNAYLSQPVHYRSVQQAYLSIFDQTWQKLVQACGNPALQAAGQRCITDRQQGACVWKASPGGWSNGQYTGYGPAGSGDACWNWFVGYRDPIANDPTVVDDPPLVNNADGSTTTTVVNPQTGQTTTYTTPANPVQAGINSITSTIPTPLLLGGLGILAFILMERD